MTIVWALIEKHGYTVACFTEQRDARLAQMWYREHYPNTTFDVLPRTIFDKWEEPQEGEQS